MGESPSRASTKLSAWLAGGQRGVAVTGASGWVGRAMTQAALEAGCRRLRLFGSKAGSVAVAGRTLALDSLHDPAPLGAGEWIVAHLAVAGVERFPDPEDRRLANEAILASALALAETGRTRRLVSASSGAVYAPSQASADRQAYNDLKRRQEDVVRAWAVTTSAPLLVPRIFNLGGPYMNHALRYALGSMIRQAQADGVIRIEARRPVLRSYVHVLEFARLVFELSLDDAASITFDTAGAETVEMADLAKAVGRVLGRPEMAIQRPTMESWAADRYVGDGRFYRAALSAGPIGLESIIRSTAAWLNGEGAGA